MHGVVLLRPSPVRSPPSAAPCSARLHGFAPPPSHGLPPLVPRLQEAGKSVGMLSLGVPPSVAMRGGFSAADAIFDGFGAGGGLTWRKARLILDRRNEQQAAT